MMGCSSEEILYKTERPYYFCYSLSTRQTNRLDSLRKHYKYYYFGEAIQEDEEVKSEEKLERVRSGSLSFFIKEVKYGTFSRYLLNAPKERIFTITGPYVYLY